MTGLDVQRRQYFCALYRQNADPYGFRSRWYEARKRSLTLAALPARRFGRVFEPGCGNGELSRELAAVSGELLGWDGDPQAIGHARQRCADLDHVSFECAWVPARWPDRVLDLIVVSELGYFLSRGELECLAASTLRSLAPDGVVLGCHWKPPVPGFVLTGAKVQQVLNARFTAQGLACITRMQDADFCLDVWSRDTRSVAQREGIR